MVNVRIFRDGYNRTNLTIGSFRSVAEIRLSAVDEPWDGPAVRAMVRVRKHFVVIETRWR